MGNNPKSLLSSGQIAQKVYDEVNDRIRVDAQYTANIEGDLEIALSATEDSVAISDGNDTLAVNSDGSINVTVLNTTEQPSNVVSFFDTATAVASGIETSIISYTAPIGKVTKLTRLEFGGENIAVYNLYLNNSIINRRRTFFGNALSLDMVFSGLPLQEEDSVILKVLHNRPGTGNFEARIQVTEQE